MQQSTQFRIDWYRLGHKHAYLEIKMGQFMIRLSEFTLVFAAFATLAVTVLTIDHGVKTVQRINRLRVISKLHYHTLLKERVKRLQERVGPHHLDFHPGLGRGMATIPKDAKPIELPQGMAKRLFTIYRCGTITVVEKHESPRIRFITSFGNGVVATIKDEAYMLDYTYDEVNDIAYHCFYFDLARQVIVKLLSKGRKKVVKFEPQFGYHYFVDQNGELSRLYYDGKQTFLDPKSY